MIKNLQKELAAAVIEPARYNFVLKTQAKKLSGMAAVYGSHGTCPITCPLNGHGCYGQSGPCNWAFTRVSDGRQGTNLADVPQQIAEKVGDYTPHFCRLFVTGDCVFPGTTRVNEGALEMFSSALPHTVLYGYTHARENLEAVKRFNKRGKRCINISANNLEEAVAFFKEGFPACCVVEKMKNASAVFDGVKIKKCKFNPEKGIECRDCKMCMNCNRKYIIVFPAHGAEKKEAARVTGNEKI